MKRRMKRNLIEEPLRQLMQELGNTIYYSLSESDRIAEAIGEIKRAGFDVFLFVKGVISSLQKIAARQIIEGIALLVQVLIRLAARVLFTPRPNDSAGNWYFSHGAHPPRSGPLMERLRLGDLEGAFLVGLDT
jgi:hypothetical protein